MMSVTMACVYMRMYMYQYARALDLSIHFLLLRRIHMDMLVGCLILLMYSCTCVHTVEFTPTYALDTSDKV